MATGILYNRDRITDERYDWNKAFNNPDFIRYLLRKSTSAYYTSDSTEIEYMEYYADDVMISATFSYCYGNIGSSAFKDCSKLSYIDIHGTQYDYSDGRRIIYPVGDEAFANCQSLTTAKFYTVRKIGKQAFKDCVSLRSIYVSLATLGELYDPDWMISIDDEAFKNCRTLSDYYGISMPIVDRIGKRAFENCIGLSSVQNIGYSICRRIDDEAFKGCYNITSVKFNTEFLTNNESRYRLELGSNIFDGCSNLSSIDIRGIYEIAHDTLGDLRSTLEEFDAGVAWTSSMSDTFPTIGSYAFSGYSVLSSVSVPYAMSIYEHAFDGCTSLNNAQIGNYKCYNIYEYAFANCESLNYITLNQNGFSNSGKLKIHGSHIFDRCTNLSTIRIYACDDIDPYAFASTDIKSVTLGITSSTSAFSYGFNYSVGLGSNAFENCSQLTSFNCLCMNVIGKSAFKGCNSLQSFNGGSYICAGVSEDAFYGTPLTSLYINMYKAAVSRADSVYLSIGEYAFRGCSNLQYLYLGDVEYFDELAVQGLSKLEYLYITGSSSFVGGITSETFSGCSSLYMVNLTNFYDIESHAFEGLSRLWQMNGNINLSTSLTVTLGEYAFKDCTNLNYVTYPFVESIGSHAFEGCINLRNMYANIYTNGRSIGAYAFSGCTALYYVDEYYMKGLSFIGSHAFDGCANLSNVRMSRAESVPILESTDAFNGLPAGYSITIPSALYSDFLNDSVWGLLSEHFYSV